MLRVLVSTDIEIQDERRCSVLCAFLNVEANGAFRVDDFTGKTLAVSRVWCTLHAEMLDRDIIGILRCNSCKQSEDFMTRVIPLLKAEEEKTKRV